MKKSKKRSPKTILKLPDLEHSKTAVLKQPVLVEFAALLRPRQSGFH
jgi:hypothetical protein